MTGPTPCFGEDKNLEETLLLQPISRWTYGEACAPVRPNLPFAAATTSGSLHAALRSNERAESTAVAGRFNPASVKGGY
jgi:hypothetical protein